MTDEMVDKNKDSVLFSKKNVCDFKELENHSNIGHGKINPPTVDEYQNDLVIATTVSIGYNNSEYKGRAALDISGGKGDLTSTKGDLIIGKDNYSLKIGVATSNINGAEAGDVRIRADGGTNRLMLGGGKDDTLIIKDGKVGIGEISQSDELHVKGTVSATKFNGKGSDITDLNAEKITIGTIDVARIPATITRESRFDPTTGHTHAGSTAGDGPKISHKNLNDIFSVSPDLSDDYRDKHISNELAKGWQDHVTKIGNPHGTKATDVGALPITGGTINGKLGIGTTSPGAGLHIEKADTNEVALKLSSNGPGWGSGIQLQNNNIIYGIYVGSGQFKICDAKKPTDADRLIINDAGNIGIGTNVPSEKLDVSGNMKVSGKIIQEDWKTPKLEDGWVHDKGIFNPPGYFLDKSGIVHFRGHVKYTQETIPALIFKLQEGYRPENVEFHTVVPNVMVQIAPNGEVTAVNMPRLKEYWLDGVTFRTV